MFPLGTCASIEALGFHFWKYFLVEPRIFEVNGLSFAEKNHNLHFENKRYCVFIGALWLVQTQKW